MSGSDHLNELNRNEFNGTESEVDFYFFPQEKHILSYSIVLKNFSSQSFSVTFPWAYLDNQ